MNWYKNIKISSLEKLPYGYWISPEGEITTVHAYQGHLNLCPINMSKNVSPLDFYKNYYKYDYVKVTNPNRKRSSVEFYVEYKNINNNQIDIIKEITKDYELKYPYIEYCIDKIINPEISHRYFKCFSKYTKFINNLK